MEQVFLTMSDVQDRYGVSRQTVTNWIKRENFPLPVKMGRSKRWSVVEINQWEKTKRLYKSENQDQENFNNWIDADLSQKLADVLVRILGARSSLVLVQPQIKNRGLHAKVLELCRNLYRCRELVDDLQALKSTGLVLDYPEEQHTEDDLF